MIREALAVLLALSVGFGLGYGLIRARSRCPCTVDTIGVTYTCVDSAAASPR